MGFTNYNPGTTWPDLDGTGGTGPLQFPVDGDPYTYEAHYVGSGGTAASHGLFGKIINALMFLKNKQLGTGYPASTSIVRTATTPIFDVTASPIASGAANTTVIHGHTIQHPLDLPHGYTLTSVTGYVNPGAGGAHGGLPGTMPTIRMVRFNVTGSSAPSTIGGPVTDSSASQAAYDAIHGTTVSSINVVVDRTQFIYYVQFTAETGANAIDTGQYQGTTFTVTP